MAIGIFRYFAPAPHIERLPEEEIQRRYPWFRWQILEATFIGYATYYLVRNNLSVVSKDVMAALDYDKAMMGNILAVTAMSYGVGKFIMGTLSDRSNPRVFMAVGLLITAFLNFAFGAASSYAIHFWLWALNGFFQGMGWPPCGRSMGHWFSEKERGLTFSIWNTSHNVGGGIAGWIAGMAVMRFGGWEYAFYVPGALALAGAVYLFWRLRDTPQSVGLPPVEVYRNDFTASELVSGTPERELSYRELLIDNVLKHKYIWLLAFANFFAYITRYSMLDWGPTYLREMKGADVEQGSWVHLALEFGGIPSTILLGWISDKIGGRRGMVASLALVPILAAFSVMLFSPAGHMALDLAMLIIIGFFIYPVINLITIMSLDLTSKKAIGTAAGFIGLFGYIGRTVLNMTFGPILDHYEQAGAPTQGWSIIIMLILAATVLSLACLASMWRMKPRA